MGRHVFSCRSLLLSTLATPRVYNNSIGGECLTAIDTPNTLR